MLDSISSEMLHSDPQETIRTASTALLHLSQSVLKLLDACPRQFQYSYLNQINSVINPEQQTSLTLGSQFHLLMQQQELGLPILSINPMDSRLQNCVQSLMNQAPDLFPQQVPQDQGIRDSEHSRTLLFSQPNQDYLLTVVYDLLILEPRQAQILDWKTYPRPEKLEWLAQSWQTRLYFYVLAETSPYQPAQISMTYWFVQPSEPQTMTPPFHQLTYSDAQHQQTRSDLETLLHSLTAWLQAFQLGHDLPQVSESKGICQRCPFIVKCQRHLSNQLPMSFPEGDWQIELADIPEITL